MLAPICGQAAGVIDGLTLTSSVAEPAIVTPASVGAPVGKRVTFSVAGRDSGSTYQWYHNGVALSGAAAKRSTYTVLVSPARAGTYQVAVGSAFGGSVLSESATLTVYYRPKIIAQPANLTLDDGQPLTLSVAATGTPEPSFQWLRDGVEIPGATSATYHVDAVNALDTGVYSVRVSNSVATVVSRRASVVVRSAPVIVDSPGDTNAYVGTPLRLSVIAYGFPKRSYQWRFNGEPIRGARAAVFVLKPALAKTGVYDVVVSNALGSATSESFTVTVNAAPKLTLAPVGGGKRVGQSHVFQVEAPAYPVPTYQWIKDGADLPGQTLSALALSPLKLADEGFYSVRVTNELGSFTTKPVKLRVGLAPFGAVKGSTYRFDTTVFSDFGDSIPLNVLFTVGAGRLIIKDFTDNTLSSEKLDFTRMANDRVRMRFFHTEDGVKLTLTMNFYFQTPTSGTVVTSVHAGGYGVIGSGSDPFTYTEPGL